MGDQVPKHTEPPSPWTLQVANAAEALLETLRVGPAGALTRLGIVSVSAPRITAGGVLSFVVIAVDDDPSGKKAEPGTVTHNVVRDLRHHYHGTRPNDPALIADFVVSEVINYRSLVDNGAG